MVELVGGGDGHLVAPDLPGQVGTQDYWGYGGGEASKVSNRATETNREI